MITKILTFAIIAFVLSYSIIRGTKKVLKKKGSAGGSLESPKENTKPEDKEKANE